MSFRKNMEAYLHIMISTKGLRIDTITS